MPSETTDRVYVWVWLPGASVPVVAGVLQASGATLDGSQVLVFRYARSYRERDDPISLYPPELPLGAGVVDPRSIASREPLAMPGCLRDAAPDAWGRRVINARLSREPGIEQRESTYLLTSGSDRIGALDFQESPEQYVPRGERATLDQLVHMAELVEAGEPIPADLAAAAGHGTSIGGARPKALLEDAGVPMIAKFSSSTDTRPVVQAEAVAMMLATHAGLNVPAVRVVRAAGKEVLLVERFDRPVAGQVRTRRQMISMLTVRGVREMSSWHQTYAGIAQEIRESKRWVDVADTLQEMFTRLVFNILVGNNDDHLRNHAAFWDGKHLALTPAYDLAPQPHSTGTSSQAIGITADGLRASQLWLCRKVAPDFNLDPRRADHIIDQVHSAIVDNYDDACDQARLTKEQRKMLWGREFCNAYAFQDTP